MEDEIKDLTKEMIEFNKSLLNDAYYKYYQSDEEIFKDFYRIFSDKRGCKNYIDIILSDMADYLKNYSLLDRDNEDIFNMGIKLVKKINIFTNKYHLNINDVKEL